MEESRAGKQHDRVSVLGRSFWLSSWKVKGWRGQEPREGTGTVTQKGEEGPMLGVGWLGWELLGCEGGAGAGRRQSRCWGEGGWTCGLPALPLRLGPTWERLRLTLYSAL